MKRLLLAPTPTPAHAREMQSWHGYGIVNGDQPLSLDEHRVLSNEDVVSYKSLWLVSLTLMFSASLVSSSWKQSVPDSVFYVPDFVSRDEERELLTHIDNAPKPKWRQLSDRRLQNWGGFPHPKVTVGEPLPQVRHQNSPAFLLCSS